MAAVLALGGWGRSMALSLKPTLVGYIVSQRPVWATQ